MINISQTIRYSYIQNSVLPAELENVQIEFMLDSSIPDNFIDSSIVDRIMNRLGANIVSVHAPYHSLNIGSKDKFINEYSMKRIVEGVELANILNAGEYIFHSTFMPLETYSGYKKWLEISKDNFDNIMKICNKYNIVPVIENTYEKDLTLFYDLFEKYSELKFCLDVGHVNCFSNISLHDWIEPVCNKIKSVHIHDNNGNEDEHLDLGKGNIDFKKLFTLLIDQNIRFNLETDIDNFIYNEKTLKENMN